MEPTQPQKPEEIVRINSPQHPSSNGGLLAQRALPSFSTVNVGTVDPELPLLSPRPIRPRPFAVDQTISLITATPIEANRIYSPIPIRPRPSLLAQTGSSTTTIPTEVDANFPTVPAEPDQDSDRVSHPAALALQGAGSENQHHSRDPERSQEDSPEQTDDNRERERRDVQRHLQLARERRARRNRERQIGRLSTDVLADSLSALSTDEPQLDSRQAHIQRLRHQEREHRAREVRRSRGQAMRERSIRDSEQLVLGGAAGMHGLGGESSGSADQASTDDERMDTSFAEGSPVPDANVQEMTGMDYAASTGFEQPLPFQDGLQIGHQQSGDRAEQTEGSRRTTI